MQYYYYAVENLLSSSLLKKLKVTVNKINILTVALHVLACETSFLTLRGK
jgi:hypothetical protein